MYHLTPDDVLVHLILKDRGRKIAKQVFQVIELNQQKTPATQLLWKWERVLQRVGKGGWVWNRGLKRTPPPPQRPFISRTVGTPINGNASSVLGPDSVHFLSTWCPLSAKVRSLTECQSCDCMQFLLNKGLNNDWEYVGLSNAWNAIVWEREPQGCYSVQNKRLWFGPRLGSESISFLNTW